MARKKSGTGKKRGTGSGKPEAEIKDQVEDAQIVEGVEEAVSETVDEAVENTEAAVSETTEELTEAAETLVSETSDDLAETTEVAVSEATEEGLGTDATADEVQPEPEPELETAAEAAPEQPTTTVIEKRKGFGGGLVGGVLAAVLGYGAAQFFPDGWPLGANSEMAAQLTDHSGTLESLRTELDATKEENAGLKAAIDALTASVDQRPTQDSVDGVIANAMGEVGALNTGLEETRSLLDESRIAVETTRQTVAENTESLETRAQEIEATRGALVQTQSILADAQAAIRTQAEQIDALEKRPLSEAADEATAAALAAYEREVSQLTASVEASNAEITAKMTEEIEGYTAEVGRLTESVEAANAENFARMAAEIDNYTAEVARLTESVETVKAETAEQVDEELSKYNDIIAEREA
ncbi:MAG: hypothetical protein AAFY03_00700 [Pseudomonadota bacterium]